MSNTNSNTVPDNLKKLEAQFCAGRHLGRISI